MQVVSVTQDDHLKMAANHRQNITMLESRKRMMIAQISGMDVLRDQERITWFWNALCNGYFDMKGK